MYIYTYTGTYTHKQILLLLVQIFKTVCIHKLIYICTYIDIYIYTQHTLLLLVKILKTGDVELLYIIIWVAGWLLANFRNSQKSALESMYLVNGVASRLFENFHLRLLRIAERWSGGVPCSGKCDEKFVKYTATHCNTLCWHIISSCMRS